MKKPAWGGGMLNKCPLCGAALQATIVYERYLTYVDGEWKFHDGDRNERPALVDVRYYCANDCNLDKHIKWIPQVEI